MDAFVATRGVFMLGSNMFKVISRLLNGSVTLPMLYHGVTIVRAPHGSNGFVEMLAGGYA